jgi:hypothetical protein
VPNVLPDALIFLRVPLNFFSVSAVLVHCLELRKDEISVQPFRVAPLVSIRRITAPAIIDEAFDAPSPQRIPVDII